MSRTGTNPLRRFGPPALGVIAAAAIAAPAAASRGRRSITDTSIRWPGWDQVLRVITLQDYNTRVVVLGTMLLGLAAGIVGTYMLLRKRALIGDALSHATLPGIAIAFVVMVAFGGEGKYLPGLLAGAAISGLLGVGCVLAITRLTRIREDAALGIVLSVSFGLGIAILGMIQKMSQGSPAGLESFIYGKTASMLKADAMLIAVTAAIVILACVALHKEFAILTFDSAYAGAQGWPVLGLDMIMMALVAAVTVIGLQAVGLILVIALLIIPPAAARFWTSRLVRLMIVAGAIGAASGLLGAGLSALVPRLPAGAVIVTVAASIFVLSMVLGSYQGVLVLGLRRLALNRRVARQHLLRAMYEVAEVRDAAAPAGVAVGRSVLAAARSWPARRLDRQLRSAARDGLLVSGPDHDWRLTDEGVETAARVVRNHRLWELYLISHADIAPSHVDRDADQIEHVLGKKMVRELETLLAATTSGVPPSPHVLGVNTGGAA